LVVINSDVAHAHGGSQVVILILHVTVIEEFYGKEIMMLTVSVKKFLTVLS
jgi:hypothetical protein